MVGESESELDMELDLYYSIPLTYMRTGMLYLIPLYTIQSQDLRIAQRQVRAQEDIEQQIFLRDRIDLPTARRRVVLRASPVAAGVSYTCEHHGGRAGMP